MAPGFQPRVNEDKIDGPLNTSSKLNHSVAAMKSDIYFMRHRATHSIKVWTSMRKACTKSPGLTDV